MNWAGYTRRGSELDAQAALRAIGIDAHAPAYIYTESRGKNRQPRVITEALMPQVVFIRGTPADFHRIATTRPLCGSLWGFSDRAWDRHVAPFIAEAQEQMAKASEQIEAGEMLQHFTPGTRLEIKDGPFRDQIATFVRTISRAHEMNPLIRAEIEVFGTMREVDIDPLSVKRSR